jgi:hypothetical protein
MDISIACSDRSQTPELEPGQAAATRRIVTEPPEARATSFVVERGDGSAVRCLIVAVSL